MNARERIIGLVDAQERDMDFNLDEAIPVLERTPPLLTTLLDDLPEDWTLVNEGPETWSPREVVAHLIHGERTDWIPRARIILQQGKYRKFDPFDRFAELKSERSLKDLLEEFDRLRSGNVATLRGWNLKEKDMELTGEHPEFGSVTMRQLLATWVVHDLSHIAQITRTMARAYTLAVGPWTAYFRVLQRDVRQ
ncbi:MAG TPA: DinB family protein [Gemmatimonadaceae bacterium]